MMQATLDTPIERAPFITPKIARVLRQLGIRTVRDLLWHLPARYEDFSSQKKIRDVALGETVTVEGRITHIQNVRTARKRMVLTQAVVEDETGGLPVIWFNQPFLARNIRVGDFVVLSGKTQLGKDGMYLSSPAYEVIKQPTAYSLQPTATKHAGRLVPIYPETHGITSRWIRFLVKKFLPLAQQLPDPLPDIVRKNQNLIDLKTAITNVHFPKTITAAQQARERLRFEEIFVIECAALQAKARFKEVLAPAISMNVDLVKKFVASLPFKLTDDQRKAAFQILRGMEKPHPMNRLLVGDVGSGKTVVAAIAALNTIQAGFQVALMAPTEVLAQQHFKELSRLLKLFKIRVALLTGAISRATPKKLARDAIAISRRKLFKEIASGEIDLLIGTHALIARTHADSTQTDADSQRRLSKSRLKPDGPLQFKNLGLAIVDEQHRFGVEQRAQLVKMYSSLSPIPHSLTPHFLTMTATPIPRTLALTIFGDLDFSLITQMPKGRQKIITEVIEPMQRRRAYEFMRTQVTEGRQVFIICPLVEESEKLEAKAATKEHALLQKEIFPELKLALLHGRMKSKEKERVMRDFRAGKYQILVSTSVVEVGIDVPNATVMIIEGAERFGLAQLYQFRGRVGRGQHQSYCFLFTESPSKKTAARVRALLKSESGADLARADLEIRGPGELTGLRQAGMPDVAMSALMDLPLIERAREEARQILAIDPPLRAFQLLQKAVDRMRTQLHLA